MGFYISFSIEGEQQISRNLLLAADKIKDWTPAFQETADTLQELFSGAVFETEGAVIDTEWPQLSPKYAKAKAKKYPGAGLLIRTGTMQESFMQLVRPDMAMIWNTASYFVYHQSSAPRKKIPRRVMLKLADQQREMVVKIFQSYFQQIINQ